MSQVVVGGPGGSVSQVVGLPNNSYKHITNMARGFAPHCVNYKKECTRLAAARDKVYQLLAHGRWFSPASSTTMIQLKVALNTIKSINLFLLQLFVRPNKIKKFWFSDNAAPSKFRLMGHFYCRTEKKLPLAVFLKNFTTKFKFSSVPVTKVKIQHGYE